MQQSSLPSGIPMPKQLILDNVAANWKKFKRAWDNYAVVVRLQRFDEEYKTATFLSAIGEEALEIYEGMTFNISTATVNVNLTSSRQLEGLSLEHVCSQYEDVFDGLGNLGTPLRLEVDETVKPVQQPLRRVPEALRTPLKEYLDDLEARGVIEKVERPTEWVNSVVITRKANGNLRLCLDPKPLNKALKRCHFPMPVIEDILPELGKAKVFTKLNCKDGYWQIKLTDESSLLMTFATPFGRYKWNRMPFGISPASEIFQLRLHKAVEGLDGVYAIADDILVAGAGDTMKDAVYS